MIEIDLTPDPRVLIALTHTPLQPLDALCELIDNAIDSFHIARADGTPVQFPLVVVDLPTRAEVDRGEGVVRVRDNGPGLTAEHARNALRAGFSGNNSFDTLGLFGMGFNVSTGKLGRVTRFLTARRDEEDALAVLVDLVKMQEQRNYLVPAEPVPKPLELVNGTIVSVDGWWPEGNPNSDFIRKLAGYSKATVRKEVGRRYATLLREESVRIVVNGEPCVAFEHCVWDATRYVERREHGRIPARFDFNTVLAHQTRCADCGAQIIPHGTECPSCKSTNFRTVEERTRGWVGIQRFDDPANFGIDLIRNGRTIRIAEQGAFFEYTDELKKSIKDYPIDSPYGRIVGEVHLNHVPVDFLKQDFQRTSEEWQRAMRFLRGDSSLQPTQPNADSNTSPVFKLYQGYRRVRTAGKTDMYMGYWDASAPPPPGKPKRISRETEQDYYVKFVEKLPGYYDDAEWWKLVEQADQQPVEELVKCPNCQADNLKEAEECLVCGHVLLGQDCINEACSKLIPRSAVTCAHCGTSQIPEIKEPWECLVCGNGNAPDDEACSRCSSSRGAPNPTSRDFLLQTSHLDDDLTLRGCSVTLADGSHSQPIDALVYAASNPIVPRWGGPRVPLLALRGQTIDIFVDLAHPLFRAYRMRPEFLIAAELGQYIHLVNGRLQAQYPAEHSIANLIGTILEKRWGDALEDSPEHVKDDARALFERVREGLATSAGADTAVYFDELTESQTASLVEHILGRGMDVGRVVDLRASGQYVRHIDESALVDLFKKAPHLFMDGKVWRDAYLSVEGLPELVTKDYQARIRATYLNCLEDAGAYLRYETPDLLITQRARASTDYLTSRLQA